MFVLIEPWNLIDELTLFIPQSAKLDKAVQWVAEAAVGDTEKIAGRREQREEMKLKDHKSGEAGPVDNTGRVDRDAESQINPK